MTTFSRRDAGEHAHRYTADEISAIKAAHSVEAVAAAYGVRLTRVGANLVGLCPLHEETRPSFTIFLDAQRYYCFGCRQGGDVVELVRRIEGLSFPEALAHLGGLAHARVPTPHYAMATSRAHSPDPTKIVQARLSEAGQAVLEAATSLYHRTLLHTPLAQQNLTRRGIGPELATRCRLGYCAGSELHAELQRRRLPTQAAWDVGLFVGRRWQVSGEFGSERLAGRITIPELQGGQPVWLTGRLVNELTDAPRYMSLPGPRPLLGLEQVAGRAAVILVEGGFDWLTLVSWGLPAASALGGSLSPAALEQLAAARVIYLAFDNDAPGQLAASRLAARLEGRARLIALPPGVKDVNELGQRREGAAQFREAVQHAARGRGHAITPVPEEAARQEVA